MKNVVKYLCAVLLVIGTSAHAWGAFAALTLPHTWEDNDGSSAYTQELGCTKSGLGTDYTAAGAPKLKFDNTGDYMTIQLASAPGTLSYKIQGNGFSSGTFKVQESADDVTYTDVAVHTTIAGSVTPQEHSLSPNTRYIKFVYTNKSSGNVGLGAISISLAPTYDVEWHVGESITKSETDVASSTPPSVLDGALGGDCSGLEFVGWTGTEIGSTPSTAPDDLFTGEVTLTSDADYYAVFAEELTSASVTNVFEDDLNISGTGVVSSRNGWSSLNLYCYGGQGSLRLSSSSSPGIAETSALSSLTSAATTISFKIKAWDDDESGIVTLSVSSGTLGKTQFTAPYETCTVWTEVSTTITGGSSSTTLTFTGTGGNRIYIKDLSIDCNTPATYDSESYITVCATCEDRTVTFAASTPSVAVTTSTYQQVASLSDGAGDVTYTLNQTSGTGWTINTTDGTVSFNGHVGEGTITASVEEDAVNGYCGASGSYTLTVTPVVPTVGGFTEEHTDNTMTLNGSEVTNKGGDVAITAYGYIYSSVASTAVALVLGGANVTTAQVAAADIALNTSFVEKTINSLNSNTTYYVRAYATNAAGTGYSDIQTVKTVTYSDYQFSCADLSITDEEALVPKTPIWITTSAGQLVRSQKALHIEGSGLAPNAAFTFTIGGVAANDCSGTGAHDLFAIRNANYSAVTADLSGAIDADVYVFYNPTATTDGLDQPGATIVATSAAGKVGDREYKSMSATLNTTSVNGRHLPSQFVIAAKWAGTWYALPADFTKTTSDTDCNGVPVAISVDADGSGNPTKAYGPSTLAYAVNMVGNGGTGTSTFRDNSKYLYLDMINNSHFALEAAGSGTSVAKGSGYATGDLGANYMWLLDQQTAAASTAAETEYHLCNAANTSNSLKLYSTANRWGLYSAGTTVATPAIRIIPLSVIEPLELSVLEWGETSLAVKSEAVNLSSGYTVTARLGSAAAAAVSSVSKIGDDLYIIRGVGSLLTGPGIGVRSLTITATPAEGTAKQAVIPVPLIISKDAAEDVDDYVTYTETQISSFAAGGTGDNKITEGRNIVKTVDVVVRKGGMLTNTSGASGDFADLHIYSGGKVDITNTIEFKNVYLRGGFSWLDNRFDELPRLKTAGANITLGTDGKVYYDLCLNSDIYYMMALPVDVPLSSVTNEEGTGTFKAWIKKYNGGARAGENSDPKWISVTSGSLQRGVGYEVAIKKRNNRPYGILRFPLLSSWSAESDFTPTVTAWGIDEKDGLKDGVTANNAGWNIVGNPFFTAFHNTNDFGSKVINYGFKPHGDPWDGTYEWDSEDASVIKFFSVPYRSFDDWHDERAIDAVLEPFFPFGVQVKSTGVLTFKAVNRDLKPSIYRKGIQEREVDVDFLLKDANGKTDNAGLTIGNTYSELFDSEDMEKTITNGTQYMKVYTMVGEYRTAFNYLPEAAAAQPIPVGYIAPAAGEYTFTLKPSGNYSQVEKVLLTDYQTSQTVDLLTEDYTFETEAGEINTRFALNVKLKAETATDMSSVEGGGIMNISVYGGDQHLVVRGLPTGADVWIYDAVGKLVASWNNVREASLRTDVPAAGVYSVRAVLGSEGVTRRAVVR